MMGFGKPPLLSLKFAVVFSLSVAAASSASLSFPKAKAPSLSVHSKATTKDLLSLMGSPQQASTVNAEIAQKLKSCFKFLVPFSPYPTSGSVNQPSRRSLRSDKVIGGGCGQGVIEDGSFYNELIWWPPAPVLELARLAVDSGGDTGAIHRILDPTVIPVPDCEGSKENKCELTRTPYGRRFVNAELNSYIELLFEIIAAQGPSIGLNVSLNRYDLFHGHLFIAVDSGRLGILFHAKEYPAYEKDVFPYNMGFCQVGSNVSYDDSMNLRNILWLAPLPSNSTREWLAPGTILPPYICGSDNADYLSVYRPKSVLGFLCAAHLMSYLSAERHLFCFLARFMCVNKSTHDLYVRCILVFVNIVGRVHPKDHPVILGPDKDIPGPEDHPVILGPDKDIHGPEVYSVLVAKDIIIAAMFCNLFQSFPGIHFSNPDYG